MMTTLFRIVLIFVSVGTFSAVMHRIRNAKMRIEDAVFWVLLCLMFVIFALFPVIPDFLARLLGIYSTANFLFLFTIFILLMKIFSMSMHISTIETKLKELVQEEALAQLSAQRESGKTPESCAEESARASAEEKTEEDTVCRQ